jgi:hypothetical protein
MSRFRFEPGSVPSTMFILKEMVPDSTIADLDYKGQVIASTMGPFRGSFLQLVFSSAVT